MLVLNKLTSTQGLITTYSVLASRGGNNKGFYLEQSQPGGFYRSVFLDTVGLRRPLAPHPVLFRGVPPTVKEVDREANGHPHHETHLVHQMIIGLDHSLNQGERSEPYMYRGVNKGLYVLLSRTQAEQLSKSMKKFLATTYKPLFPPL